jgi:DNA-binding Lrp family transcriptional regulator
MIKEGLKMNDLLNDELNLQILENICSGSGVEVNISELSRSLKKHRNTIRDRIENLLEYKIINRPSYPFFWLYNEYPLMVIARADLPRDEQTVKFIEEDPHIFAAFFKKDEQYNTFLIEFFTDIGHHQRWREEVTRENKIPPRETRYPADIMYFDTNFLKYNPAHMVQLIEDDMELLHGMLNNYKLDELSIQILKKLAYGEGIQTNEHFLAEKLGVHRRTIERRIDRLIESKIVLPPTCRFPRLLVPPDYNLVFSLVEIKKNAEKILSAWRADPHIPLMLKAGTGRYTHLIFSSFSRIRDHLKWEEDFDQRFPDCVGAIWNKYLSPSMTFSIAQQFVSRAIINRKLDQIRGKDLVDMMKSSE